MLISNKQFDSLVGRAIDELPEKFKRRLNNVAIFVENMPTPEQLRKAKLSSGQALFGLFEGYAQAKKLNYGPVLPDRITIFRQAIIRSANSSEEIKEKIINTVKHEIAHHFGSDEAGARRASKPRTLTNPVARMKK